MNSQLKAAQRYNLRITKVVSEGKFVDVIYEVCDWKTGKITKSQ